MNGLSAAQTHRIIKVLHENRLITSRGCWEWTGTRDANGYGIITDVRLPTGQKPSLVHRLALASITGFYILDPAIVRHWCDNPPCFNPLHLFPGTTQQNILDCVEKGRNRPKRAERHPRARLSNKEVLQICESLAAHERCTDIAVRFGVAPFVIESIKAGKTWRSVTAAFDIEQFKFRSLRHVRNATPVKLNANQVAEIRRRLSNRESSVILSREYGVTVSMISTIKHHKSWN